MNTHSVNEQQLAIKISEAHPHSIFEVDYDKEHWANTQINEVTLSCKEVKN